ncbi:MAG: OadG family protein [Cycloclasticus sp.]|nr:OadG family protein [Cycloclasticus sp.]
MTIVNLIEQGVELMFLGMGMVFFILGLLIVVIKGVSALVLKYEPEALAPNAVNTHKIHEDVVAAISMAVQRFRSK